MSLRRKRHNHRNRKKQPIEHTGFYPYLQHYLEGIAVKGFSQATQNRHESHIRRFAIWCEERGLDSPVEITKPILERYQKHLYHYRKTNGQPLSFTSQKTVLISLRSFFRWLTQKNHLGTNPASELELPKPPKQLPRTILSLEQIHELLAQPDIKTPDGLRDRCIMELFYGSGIRRTELANLKPYDIDLNRGILAIRGGSCHLFRHAMATHMLENGADIRFIQAMLGHGDISSTQVYTRVSVEKLRAVHAATHPRGLKREKEDRYEEREDRARP
jgi:integrase/recombinase XerD